MSSRLDRSQSGRTQRLKQKAVASFYNANPTAKISLDPSTLLLLQGGNRSINTYDITGVTTYDAGCCCTTAPVITNLYATWNITTLSPPYNSYYGYLDLTWDLIADATSYIVISSVETDVPVITGDTSARVYAIESGFYENRTLTLTAITNCGDISASTDINPCFLAGSLVQMADGSQKVIEEVRVGDTVLGAFGETNMILALHRPLLGSALMCKINDEHSTTNHHPHISADRKFYCGNPALVSGSTYGHVHKVIDADGAIVDRMLHGLKKERILPLSVGVELKTVEGSRITKTLETYAMPPDTQLYNLVVGGSHTYHVDGYAVTGWPREDDFDYDTWTAIYP